MTNTKTTKRALISSVLALFLCFAMLLGTTFAWFTDSVTSANNVITVGNLDVELYYQVEGQTDWTKVTEQTNIFKANALWEPGHTEVVKLKVVNEGTLALKYQLGVNVAQDATFKNALNETVNLSEFIKYGIVDGAQTYTRDTAIAAVDATATALSEAYKSELTTLTATTEKIVTMVVYMPTSVGNEANPAKGEATPELKLGINLFATQVDFESDSFDETYDKDLEPLEEGDVLRIINGVQYVYTPEGDSLLYLVPEDYAASSVVVPEGIKSIGNYAFAYNTNVKEVVLSSTVTSLGRGFDSSTVEKVVLNEGLEVIDSRAFKSTSALKEVVISSTVKTIADNAFQKSAIKTITIPANVETIGEAAFGSSKIETVILEGNTSIQGYAFRGCPELRTVHLKGDDNTFIPSTLNGRNSMWFCNGESNNPNTSNITFYVENETVKERVLTAMGAERNNTTVIVKGKVTVSVNDANELQEALNNATQNTIINFATDITGNVAVTQKANVDFVIDGNGKKFTGVMTVFGKGNQKAAEALTIKNINFVAANGADSCIVSPDRAVNNSYSYSHNVTVDNCTFTDPDGVLDCAAIRHEDGGDNDWVVKNCVVDNTMHSLLQVNNVDGKLTIDNCTVSSKNGANLNSCTNVEFKNSKFDVTGYAVRFGVSSGGNFGTPKTYILSNNNLKSACADGDAVIIIRASAADATLILAGNIISGTTEMSGVTSATTIIK